VRLLPAGAPKRATNRRAHEHSEVSGEDPDATRDTGEEADDREISRTQSPTAATIAGSTAAASDRPTPRTL
jgi:hypothetical protein